jgi:RNA polymerase sigma-70 factor (ECF subfamily)
LAFARAATGNWTDAEDLTQEAFLAAYQRWDEVADYDSPAAFVRRVVANKSVSSFRSKARERLALSRLPSPKVVDTEGRDPAFWASVGRLPMRQRHVIALHYLDDRSVADIASVLGVAEGTVKAHLHAARKALASMLGTDLEEDD